MFASQRTAEGVGLAANQIGVDLKVFVYDCPDDEGARHVGVVCNPELVELPADQRRLDDSNEGCLSVPTAYAPLARPDYAEVTGQDEKGNPIKVRGTGYFARCLQHETDHLYGYLYIDRLSKRDRKDALRQMAENEPRYPVVAQRLERPCSCRMTGGRTTPRAPSNGAWSGERPDQAPFACPSHVRSLVLLR